MANTAELALPLTMSGEGERDSSLFEGPLTAFASVLSGYFILAAGSLYWLVTAAGALGAQVFPRSLIKRWPLAWLISSTGLTAALTQAIPGFFPDYSNPHEVLCEIGLWLSLGLMARTYLLYTEYADTFDGLNASIASRPLERSLARCASPSNRCGLCARLGRELRPDDPPDDTAYPAQCDKLFCDRGLRHCSSLGPIPARGARAHKHSHPYILAQSRRQSAHQDAPQSAPVLLRICLRAC
jgi:hypothetical protein